MRLRAAAIWVALAVAMIGPVAIAAASPLMAYRDAVYIAASLAGAVALSLLLLQPLLAGAYLPGPDRLGAKRWHRWSGAALALAVIVHIGGLYLTSPPDTWDALLLVSPTPFSIYGVTAMWAVIATLVLVALRRWLRWRPSRWALVHNALAIVVVGGTVAHAWLITGTMGLVSKALLCAAVLVATVFAIIHLRIVKPWRR